MADMAHRYNLCHCVKFNKIRSNGCYYSFQDGAVRHLGFVRHIWIHPRGVLEDLYCCENLVGIAVAVWII